MREPRLDARERVAGWIRALFLFGPALEEAATELRAGARAHALTLVSLVWGAASVILLVSLGAGFNRYLDVGVEKTGARYVMAWGQYTTSATAGARPGAPVQLEINDYDLARASVGSAWRVGAEIQRTDVHVQTPRRSRATVVAGVSEEIGGIQSHQLARGRFIEAEDDRDGRRVAVLGASAAETFFGSTDPLGATIQIGGVPFDVVGVLAPKGSQLVVYYDLHDRMVFVPLGAARRLFQLGREIDRLYLEPRRLDEEPAMRAELMTALSARHHLETSDVDALGFLSIPEIMAPFGLIGLGLQMLLGLIGTGTLAMAGVGVANLMVAQVQSRLVELGVRRACGARRSDLLVHLLAETIAVVLCSGSLGVAAGALLVTGIGWLPLPPDLPAPRLSPSAVATTFFVLLVVGVLAGVAPARQAANVDPSLAMRAT